MGVFQNRIQIVEKPKPNKPDKVNFKSVNGYHAIGELDEHRTLTAKNPVVATVKPKTKTFWFTYI